MYKQNYTNGWELGLTKKYLYRCNLTNPKWNPALNIFIIFCIKKWRNEIAGLNDVPQEIKNLF